MKRPIAFANLSYLLWHRYAKQIEKAMKRYQKWQDARNPPKPVEIEVYSDGTNEWTAGLNKDLGDSAKKSRGPSKEVCGMNVPRLSRDPLHIQIHNCMLVPAATLALTSSHHALSTGFHGC